MLMNTSILPNVRRTSLAAVFAIAAIALLNARAQADDPQQVDQVTVVSKTVKTVDRDSATGAPIQETTSSARIQYDPVTLTTNSGVALLKDSVQRAASKLCASMDTLNIDNSACVRNAVQSAMAEVGTSIARARSTAAVG
jgi:UrcA family protein